MTRPFRRCSAEDGVVLLLAIVRVKFAVLGAQWREWRLVAVPQNGEATDRTTVFRISCTGLPLKVTDSAKYSSVPELREAAYLVGVMPHPALPRNVDGPAYARRG
jgi:hypothetical protein